MITVKINDSTGLEIDDNDVVMVSYTNEKMIDIGAAMYDHDANCVVLQLGETWVSWGNAKQFKVEVLGNLAREPKLKGYIGKHRFDAERKAKQYIDAMYNDLLGLPVEVKKKGRSIKPIGTKGFKRPKPTMVARGF